MDDRKLSKIVHHAVDTSLSGIEGDPWLAQRLLANVKGEVKVKKKLSVGLVLAIVLMLIALGALAAVILSGRQFVEQELVPMMSESVSDQWTQEEVDKILRIASENGIVLPEDMLLKLQQGDGQYKETLMRIFVKVDLGYYPATWPIEDQAWYEAMLVEFGLLDVQTRFVPEGDEISLEQALEIAVASIKNDFGDTADVTDEATYLRFVEYRQMIPEGVPLPRKWYIRYEALLPTLNSYDYVISTDGRIEESNCELGIYDADGSIRKAKTEPEVSNVSGFPSKNQAVSSFDVRAYYENTYGLHQFKWTQEVWMAYQRDLEQATDKFDVVRAILRQRYDSPDAQSISMDQAIEAAINAIVEKGLITRAELEADYTANPLYLSGTSQPVWKIRLYTMYTSGPYVYDLFHAEVNAYTGEVQNVVHYAAGGDSKTYEADILYEVLEKELGAGSNG